MRPRSGNGTAHRPDMSSLAVLGVGLLAAVSNANFLLARPLGSTIDLSTAVISELSVAGQPGAVWFRLGDAVAGVSAALLAAPLLAGRRAHPGPGPDVRPAAVGPRTGALLAFGVGTLVSAVVPMPCADSLGDCPAGSGARQAHDVATAVATGGALVGSAVLAWRTRTGLPRLFPVLATATAAGCVVTAGWEGATLFASGDAAGGAAQRIQVLAISAWLILEAMQINRERTPLAP